MDAGDIDALRTLAGEDDPGAGTQPTQLAPGDMAQIGPDGLAIAPASAPDPVKAIIAAGNQIASKPYKYGGGHGKWNDTGYDCSGSVSYALHGAGLLDQALASGDMESWGDAGPGPVGDHLRQGQPRLHGGGRHPLRHQRPHQEQHALAGRHALVLRLRRPPPGRALRRLREPSGSLAGK